jgi:SAM-dependent methyltransferase
MKLSSFFSYLKTIVRPMKPINSSLLRQAQDMLTDPRVGEILNAQCDQEVAGAPKSINTAIHPSDQMLTYSIRILENVNQSVSQYFCVALQQYRATQRLLDLAFPQGLDDKLILDFACGYGRALRFLVQTYPAQQIWASDIQDDAVAFVQSQFGVNAMVSEADPENFQPGKKFQFIWVASLFTHLPDRLFRVWIARLYALLADDGFLAFSVHDEAILPPGYRLAANGMLFQPESEIGELDSAVYGTTHVNEAYVQSVFAQNLGLKGNHYVRIPRGLADLQDLYVLPKASGESLERFAAFRQGAWGWVEYAMANGVSQDAPTVQAYLSGWAKSLDRDSSVESVYAEVDGIRYPATLGIARPDLAQAWGGDFMHYGWELRLPIARATSSFVSVFAQLSTGERGLVYFGILEPQHLVGLAPWGYLDASVTEADSLVLGGWAAASGKKITSVSIKINGTPYNATLGKPRQDVCNVLGDSGYLHAGWNIRIPVSEVRQPVEIQIVANADDGESRAIYQGSVQAA